METPKKHKNNVPVCSESVVGTRLEGSGPYNKLLAHPTPGEVDRNLHLNISFKSYVWFS